MPDQGPGAFDSEKEWIEYCMGDGQMQEEHPDEDERYAACKGMWDDRKSRKRSGRERRFLNLDRAGVEVVTRDDGQPSKIRGVAAVFYDGTPQTQYDLWDGVVERIMPGAFARAIKEKQDVRALFNHDADNILGRTAAGTLALSTDKIGLRYSITPDDTQIARDVTAYVKRRDVTGSSFGFLVQGETWRKEDDIQVRELNDIDLFDVGPVTFPAYEATSVDARAREVLEARMHVSEDAQRRAMIKALKDKK